MAERKNWHQVRYGTAEGEIKFGHLHDDNEQSAFIARNGRSKNHYITLDQTGGPNRKHGTICKSPGAFQVEAAAAVPVDTPGIMLDAENGDIVIKAPNGRIRMEAINVDILAIGGDGSNGNVQIEANEKVLVKTKAFDVQSKVSTKIFSEKTVDVIGNSICNLYGGILDCADGSTKIIGSKTPSTNEEQNRVRTA